MPLLLELVNYNDVKCLIIAGLCKVQFKKTISSKANQVAGDFILIYLGSY